MLVAFRYFPTVFRFTCVACGWFGYGKMFVGRKWRVLGVAYRGVVRADRLVAVLGWHLAWVETGGSNSAYCWGVRYCSVGLSLCVFPVFRLFGKGSVWLYVLFLLICVFPQVEVIRRVLGFYSNFLLFDDGQYKVPQDSGNANFVHRELVRRFAVTDDGRARLRWKDKGTVGGVPAAIRGFLGILLFFAVVSRKNVMARRRDRTSVNLFFGNKAFNAKIVRSNNRAMGLAIAAKRVVAVSKAVIRARVRRFVHDTLGENNFFKGDRAVWKV